MYFFRNSFYEVIQLSKKDVDAGSDWVLKIMLWIKLQTLAQ